MGLGDDSLVAWTSPQQSQEAAPAWSQWSGFAPQIPAGRAVELFTSLGSDAGTSAASDSGTPERWLAICRLDYNGNADSSIFKSALGMGAPELEVEVRASKAVHLHVSGPEDRSWVYVSVPLLSRSSPPSWEWVVDDRDELSWTRLGTLRTNLRAPLKAQRGNLELECRAAPEGVVEKEFQRDLGEVDTEISSIMESMGIEPKERTLGVEPVRLKLRAQVMKLAAWLGWANVRVARRIDWSTRVFNALRDERRDWVEAQVKEAPPTANFDFSGGSYAVTVKHFGCGDSELAPYRSDPGNDRKELQRVGCVLKLTTQNTGEESLGDDIGDVNGWNIVVARADGEVAQVHFLRMELAHGAVPSDAGSPQLAPGETGTAVFGVDREFIDRDHPPVLVVMHPFLSHEMVTLPVPKP